VAIPHTFTNGTVADADQVNANFQAVSDAIDASGVGVGATDPTSPAVGQLFFNTTDQTLRVWSGSSWLTAATDACSAAVKSSCQQVKDCGDAVSAVKTIRIDGADADIYCDMDIDEYGWMLVSNRRGGAFDNTEACGSNVATFFSNGCGSADAVGYGDSYAMPINTMMAQGYEEVLFVQNDASGTRDLDDAFRMTTGNQLFFADTTTVHHVPITQVCDWDGDNCDSTDVFWKYVGRSWFHNASCFSGFGDGSSDKGNYGLCHNGAAANGNQSNAFANSLYGDRSEYAETKWWSNNRSETWQERIYVR
jgi:hypothetical protein